MGWDPRSGQAYNFGGPNVKAGFGRFVRGLAPSGAPVVHETPDEEASFTFCGLAVNARSARASNEPPLTWEETCACCLLARTGTTWPPEPSEPNVEDPWWPLEPAG